jgi:hypothetical protein
MMANTIDITTTVTVDLDEVWGNVLGGGTEYWARYYTAENAEIGDGRWDTPATFRFAEFDERTGEATTWHTVTPEDLARAFVRLKAEGWTHCGGHPVNDEDVCTGDAILQYATFGEFIYG